MDITTDVARLLLHCKSTGGYMTEDPIPMDGGTVDEAETLGLVDVSFDGTAVLTPAGLVAALSIN